MPGALAGVRSRERTLPRPASPDAPEDPLVASRALLRRSSAESVGPSECGGAGVRPEPSGAVSQLLRMSHVMMRLCRLRQREFTECHTS